MHLAHTAIERYVHKMPWSAEKRDVKKKIKGRNSFNSTFLYRRKNKKRKMQNSSYTNVKACGF